MTEIVEVVPIPSHQRLARLELPDEPKEVRPYDPSGTERLLEEVCLSFGTELGEAFINPWNGTKLVRTSRPAIVTHRGTGERRALQFQYSRLSPFLRCEGKVIELYREHTKSRKKSNERVLGDLMEAIKDRNNGQWDVFRDVTDNQFIPGVGVARWPKELYFAVYRLGEAGLPEEELQPFTIHDSLVFRGIMPDVHITFQRQPRFVRHDWIEPTPEAYDGLHFSFPRQQYEHEEAVSSAVSVSPLDKLRAESRDGEQPETFRRNYFPRTVTHDISSDMSRTLTMGYIQAYLRKLSVGATL
jgi:hypothetical protein